MLIANPVDTLIGLLAKGANPEDVGKRKDSTDFNSPFQLSDSPVSSISLLFASISFTLSFLLCLVSLPSHIDLEDYSRFCLFSLSLCVKFCSEGASPAGFGSSSIRRRSTPLFIQRHHLFSRSMREACGILTVGVECIETS